MPDDPGVEASLRARLLPIETVNPDQDSADLFPLIDYLGDATIVGMGEATHGTSEFFGLKHRLFRFLVRELGFRIFAMEATFSEALVVDEYVRHGTGDPEAAVGDISSWVWDTEEVLELVEWMRSFNRGRPMDDRIRFYGLDAQYNRAAARAIRRYLRSADPSFLGWIEDDLDSLASANVKQDPDIVEDLFRTADELADRLTDRFEEHRSAYVEETSARDWDLARHHVRVLSQVVEQCRLFRNEEYLEASNLRDRHMAENLRWVREHEDGERAAVWGHNAHIKKNRTESNDGTELTLGELLDERFGEDYYALGFEFGRGEFRAYPEHPAKVDTEVTTISVDPLPGERPSDEPEASADTPPDGRTEPPLNDVLTSVDEDLLFVDFDDALSDPALRPWLESPHLTNSIGSIFGSGSGMRYQVVEFPAEFDGLLFVTETTATTPL